MWWSKEPLSYRLTTVVEPLRGATPKSDRSSHKIPSAIFVLRPIAIMSSSNQDQAAKQRNPGRVAGSVNYSEDELKNLLKVIEEVLPVGPDRWETVAQRHANTWPHPGRDALSCRRKYNNLQRKRIPTGNPEMPWDIKMARRIKSKIRDLVNMGDGEDAFDLVNGFPKSISTDQNVPGTNQQPPPQPPAVASTAQVAGVDVVPPPGAPVILLEEVAPPAPVASASIGTGTQSNPIDQAVPSVVSSVPTGSSKRSYLKQRDDKEKRDQMYSDFRVLMTEYREIAGKQEEARERRQMLFMKELLGNRDDRGESGGESDTATAGNSPSIIPRVICERRVKKKRNLQY